MPYPDSDYERSWKMQTKGVTLYPATLERLYAAAPELLAALKLLRDPDGDGEWRCDCDDPHFEGGMCENCVATAAIAKAEGRSE